MDTNLKGQYQTLTERVVVEKAEKTRRKADRKRRLPLHTIYRARDLAILEAHGWKVHTFIPGSYGAPRTWLMTPA